MVALEDMKVFCNPFINIEIIYHLKRGKELVLFLTAQPAMLRSSALQAMTVVILFAFINMIPFMCFISSGISLRCSPKIAALGYVAFCYLYAYKREQMNFAASIVL